SDKPLSRDSAKAASAMPIFFASKRRAALSRSAFCACVDRII
ncbi:hypothetical protein ABIB82_005255, partial [Bradyrhizobium sp. i1.8.4]